MDQRIVEFIAGLRAAGVRVSLAESADAFRALEHIGVTDRDLFRSALRTTLVKDAVDMPTFEKLFPYYFGSGGPPLMNPDAELSPGDMQHLKDALRDLLGDNDRLRQLMRYLLEGVNPTREELERMGNQAGVPLARHPYQQAWLTQRMLRQLGMDAEFQDLMEQLIEKLEAMGMDRETVRRLAQIAAENARALQEQMSQYVGARIAQNAAQNPRERQPIRGPDLMQRAFSSLGEREIAELRNQVRRLAARLRSRAALRQRRGKRGVLDAKRTIRANLRNASVPLDLKHKRRHLKPKLVLICDVSTSVRPVVEFMLRLVYELQDQIHSAHSFIFIDDIIDVSSEFAQHRPETAVERVLDHNPPGYYNTNLGYSLAHFCKDYLNTVDHRTTVIVLGDGRNNFLNPRLDSFQEIKKRARRVVWLNPENPRLWGTGDSDMLQYLPICHAAHEVGNLAQLAEAVDRLFDAR
ncbi:MAG: VWA domain-containing protein [Chloroflexota bacterium]|nr:VWA domain-containing protein [Chloroflexota bacterium]